MIDWNMKLIYFYNYGFDLSLKQIHHIGLVRAGLIIAKPPLGSPKRSEGNPTARQSEAEIPVFYPGQNLTVDLH
jgi:hypothetical protein